MLGIVLSGLFLLFNNTDVYAESDSIDTVIVSVPVSCSITGTVGSEHTDTVEVGTYTEDIGETTFKVLCNDSNGFAVYAIGYSDDTYGNTVMKPSTLAETNAIATGTATSGSTSNWAMKLAAVSGDYTPTLETGFNAYHAVPTEYTKVASLGSSTDATVGSSFKSTYAAYISQAQPADTYTGKVKYTVIHPANGSEPLPIYTMQEVSNWGNSVSEGQEVIGVDSRDGKSYNITRLADGNLWMTQNLDFDIDSTRTYTPADTDIPANWTPTLSTHSADTTTWLNDLAIPESYDPGDLFWNGIVDSNGLWAAYNESWIEETESRDESLNPKSSFISTSGDSHYHVGNYYNWTAAIAMNDSTSYATSIALVDQSICPAGWTLPRGGYGDDTFYSLINGYDTYVHESSTMANGTNFHNSPFFFNLSGEIWYEWNGSSYDITMVNENIGQSGELWTAVSSRADYYDGADTIVIDLYGGDYHIYPGIWGNAGQTGLPVRCIARPVTSDVLFSKPTEIADLYSLQDFNYLSPDDKQSVLKSMEENTTYDLIDTRDNRTYQVAKLKDGNIWMAENLDLGRTELTADLTSSNTNLATTVTASTFNSWKKTTGTGTYSTGEFIPISGTDTTSGTLYGTLYNYYAASAGTISGGTNSSNAQYDICPAGWRLPTGNSSGEFRTLYNKYNSIALMRAPITENGAAFSFAGRFEVGAPSTQGSYGYYWSATRRNGSDMYGLNLYGSGVSAPDDVYRAYGYSIRCVAK